MQRAEVVAELERLASEARASRARLEDLRRALGACRERLAAILGAGAAPPGDAVHHDAGPAARGEHEPPGAAGEPTIPGGGEPTAPADAVARDDGTATGTDGAAHDESPRMGETAADGGGAAPGTGAGPHPT